MSYSSVANHGSMVFDAIRNELYAKAIRKLVRPDSVVMDLGAGMGVHGLLAAAAGGARVYLVEPQPIVHEALKAARAAGLQDRIVIVQERIENAKIPEPVDLIVSVFTGNLLFSEDLLPSLFHARDRHLKPGGVLLPDRAELWLAPLCAPELHDQRVARWSKPVMGLNYSAARQFAANETFWLRHDEIRGTSKLAGGALVAEVDLATFNSADCHGQALVRADTSGLCHGLLAWIRIRLLDEWLSTAPDVAQTHWSPVMLPIDPPLPVVAGEELKLTLDRPAYGDWTWTVKAQAGTRRHSTFLANFAGAKELRRSALDSRPLLSDRGQRAQTALELFRQGLSVQEVVDTLEQTWRLGTAETRREVQALAMRYGDLK